MRFELESFGDAEATISRFVEFYYNERARSAIRYRTLGEKCRKWKVKCTEKV